MRKGQSNTFTVAGSLVACTLVLVGGLVTSRQAKTGGSVLKPIEELRVRMTGVTKIPDPAKIELTGDWYYLDHISSGLASFDSEQKKFMPLFARSWSTKADGTHLFTLRPGIRFHDGTPITTKDILWTLKRQLILKTSTHFPLWDYIVDCENLKHLDDGCEGLQAPTDHEIAIRLKTQTDSFFLQLASPETGIWAAKDMNPETLELKPTLFSGPYWVKSLDEDSALLSRNPNSPISDAFPDSPRHIRLKRVELARLDQALKDRDVDLVIRPYRPLDEPDWQKSKISTQSTTPSIILFLYGTGSSSHLAVGRDLIEQLWKTNRDPNLTAADRFLPFTGRYGLTRKDFLAQLPERTASRLRVLCPEGFFSEAFLKQVSDAAQAVGTHIEFSSLPRRQWFAMLDDPKAADKYDFVLRAYAASERYPAVQLRYITGNQAKPPIDLKKAELPDLDDGAVGVLQDYQRWLLKSGLVVPFYFNTMLFLHQEAVDMGQQPSTDAEIELWRVREKVER